MNSPQSQKLPVASAVITKTVQAASPTIQPTILFTRLNFIVLLINLERELTAIIANFPQLFG
jgi:hypothetical protein